MSLKQLTNTDHLWKSFLSKIEERLEFHHKQLAISTESIEIYRHQGAIKELQRWKKLKEEINGDERK
jgi:hypothetical protein